MQALHTLHAVRGIWQSWLCHVPQWLDLLVKSSNLPGIAGCVDDCARFCCMNDQCALKALSFVNAPEVLSVLMGQRVRGKLHVLEREGYQHV